MTLERDHPERSIFLTAAELSDPAERAAYLDCACGGDAALRGAVEGLLAAHERPENLLDGSPPPLGATLAYAVPGSGTFLAGRYKLREKLGEGGMGSVWVADQSEPVQRRVAIKLIKAGSDSRSVLARFEQERQALALMDHPNIAKVHDAGVDGQQPYFVMELIKGVPLTKYCDDARLTMRQRLELFIPVCQAVQHAHTKGVIHRDLKPGNILVALYDGRAVPKVIDFGVAKATGTRLTDQTIYTEVGSLVGTLEYMSPEQAELNNLDIDTRTDVYALGVILYELLTGSVPFSRRELSKAGLGEMLRVIKEVEPPKPSTKLSGSGTLPSIAANRYTEPAKLTNLVKGEIDWIVMKALEKDRGRRYETANGFAADVQRYLSGEAVTAAPPSAGYRLKKVLKRNRGKAVAAGLVLAALIAGVVSTTLGLLEAHRQEERAVAAAVREGERADGEGQARRAEEEQRKAAVAKEAEASAMLQFFEDKVFAAGRPKGKDGGLGKDVTLRDAVVASLPSLATRFKDQPLVEARLRLALGTTFSHLGEPKAAAEQAERARAILTERLGPDHPDTLMSVNNLAVIYFTLGRYAEVLSLHETIVAARRRAFPPDHPDTLKSVSNLANAHAALGRHEEAIKVHEETLATRRRLVPAGHPDLWKSMSGLAVSYAALNRHEEALKLFEESLAICRRIHPADHPNTWMILTNVAATYGKLGRTGEALTLKEEVLAAQRRVLPRHHPDTLGSMNNLALSYTVVGRYPDAMRLGEEALAAYREVLPPDHRDTVTCMSNLADSYQALGRHADALKLREETLAARKRTLPPDHPDTLHSMGNLASCYAEMGRNAEALKLDEETVAVRKRVMPADHPDTLEGMFNLANSYEVMNRHADALKLREETLAIQRRAQPNHPATLNTMYALASSLFRSGRDHEALSLTDECITKAAGKAVDRRLLPSVIDLRLRYFSKGDDAGGCRATAAMWEKLNRTDADSQYTAACLRAVTSSVYAKLNQPAEATADADRAMAWLKKAIAAGFRDAGTLQRDLDLNALRERPDFKQVLKELKGPAKP